MTEGIASLQPRSGKTAWIPSLVAIAALTVAIVVAVTARSALKRANDRIDQLEWDDVLRATSSAYDTVSLDVGTIQFLKRGYSIELTQVKYESQGLSLQGYVGNPTNLWLSNLTLTFTAYKPFYQQRDAYLKRLHELDDPALFVWLSPDELGHAQATTIPSLGPRTRELFSVTVPNVTQTKDGLTLSISFGGERYSYSF